MAVSILYRCLRALSILHCGLVRCNLGNLQTYFPQSPAVLLTLTGPTGTIFLPPRACALRNGPRTRARSHACSSAIATLAVSHAQAPSPSAYDCQGRTFAMRISNACACDCQGRTFAMRISKAASVSVFSDSSSGGSDYTYRTSEQPVAVHQDLGPALPTRTAVGRAVLHGRYRPESDSYSAPRADSRAC